MWSSSTTARRGSRRRTTFPSSRERWQRVLELDGQRFANTSNLAVGTDYVAAAVSWSSSQSSIFMSGTDVAVFERASGALRWRTRFIDANARRGDKPALIVDPQGQLVVATTFFVCEQNDCMHHRGALRRFAAGDGVELWRVDANYADQPPLCLVGGHLLASSSGLSRIALDDGHAVWNTPMQAPFGMPLAVLPDGDFVIVYNNYSFGSSLMGVRYDVATGEARWVRYYGDGDHRYTMLNLRLKPDGELLLTGYGDTRANVRKPVAMRLNASDGAMTGINEVILGDGLDGLFASLNVASDGQLWTTQLRRPRKEQSATGKWLTRLDASGQPPGNQGLGLYSWSGLVRRAFHQPLGAPERGRLLVAGPAVGGEKVPGVSIAGLDGGTTASGDLDLTLEPLGALQSGRPYRYAATVRYTGDTRVGALLYLHLPWSAGGPLPTCSGVDSFDCHIDGSSGWYQVTLWLDPGAVVRVAGTQTAGDLAGAWDASRGDPALQGVVIGQTALVETNIDNNVGSRSVEMSLFADGFE